MSIKPNELRLGNLLQDRKGNICIVDAIEDDDFRVISSNEISLPVRKIKLTEEWLIKLRFEKTRSNEFTLGKGKVFFYLYKDTKSNTIYHIASSGNITIKTVHQLQNLFFAHANKELTFKI